MESPNRVWRTVVGSPGPLTFALLLLLGAEAGLRGLNTSHIGARLWQLAAVAMLCAITALASRRSFTAALVAAAALPIGSVLIRLGDVLISPPVDIKLLVTEVVAVMALIAVLVREASTSRAVIGLAVVLVGTASAWSIRPNYRKEVGGAVRVYEPAPGIAVTIGGILLVASVGLGLYLRLRDRERRRSVEAEVLAAQRSERMALARDLHDVVAHYVTTIVVHSQAAEAVLDLNPDAAREVLPVITSSGTEALAAMRTLVGTLRGSEPAGSGSADPTSDLTADIRTVTEESGLPVHLELDLVEQVPPKFERSVLRLVQESLTNSRKHAADVTRVDVSVSTREGVIHLRVADNGSGAGQAPIGGSGGYGLVGMRERVELLGGTFTAGARPGAGWEVQARIPISTFLGTPLAESRANPS